MATPAESRTAKPLLLVFVLLLGWSGLIALRDHRVTVALASLPAGMQEASYRRAYEELATTCAREPAQLEAHCQAQAEFILALPQCDEECRRLARAVHPAARR